MPSFNRLLILTIVTVVVSVVSYVVQFGCFSCVFSPQKHSTSLYADKADLTVYQKAEQWVHPNNVAIPIPDHQGYLIAIFKQQHVLHLYHNGVVVAEYPVNIRGELSQHASIHDEQTPEGVFVIWEMMTMTDPPWGRWMGLDTVKYAKELYRREHVDGEQVLSDYERTFGLIADDLAVRVFNRHHPHEPLLRGLGIHGGGFSQDNDWTSGSIAMDTADAVEVFDSVQKNPNHGVGTVVVIQD